MKNNREIIHHPHNVWHHVNPLMQSQQIYFWKQTWLDRSPHQPPHHDWGQTTGLGRRLFVGSLCERSDDPLPVAQRANLNHLESRDTMQGAVLQHVNTLNTVVARIQSKLIESHPKHTDTRTNLVACAPRWQASMGKRKWLSSIIQSQSVSP